VIDCDCFSAEEGFDSGIFTQEAKILTLELSCRWVINFYHLNVTLKVCELYDWKYESIQELCPKTFVI
jgi:hypothetical protein